MKSFHTTFFRSVFFVLAAFVTVLSISPTARAGEGDEGFIYGKITLRSGKTYQGAMRWGKEEVLWNHTFNGTKTENPFAKYVSSDDANRMRKQKRHGWWANLTSWFGWGSNKNGGWGNSWNTEHEFKCAFGDIAKINVRSNDEARLTLKDGSVVDIDGGSNDIGATIKILDPINGEAQLRWKTIDMIEFMPTPKSLPAKFGTPLYGEVKTLNGTFTGLIQWDKEEALDNDMLDGENDDDNNVGLRFGNITSIKKYRRGVTVKLKSGEDQYLSGTNDVDEDNRGIVVSDPRFGNVVVTWEDFQELILKTPVSGSIAAYSDFAAPKKLTAMIQTKNGETLSSEIAYDLDESLDIETLDGSIGGTKYEIPFRKVASITNEGSSAQVQLTNGEKLRLDDSNDVNEGNSGIVLLTGAKPRYILWSDVQQIRFATSK